MKLPPALSSALATGEALNAAGEQPLWSLQIRPRGVSFSSEGGPVRMGPNPGPETAADGALWSTTLAGAGALRATITASPCHDAATGLSFPFTSEVETGGTTYRGCAAAAGQGLGPRG